MHVMQIPTRKTNNSVPISAIPSMQKLKKIKSSRVPRVVAAALISTSLFLHAAPSPPLAANYIYEVTSEVESKSYIFGSTHGSSSNMPINLGKCAKKILTEIDLVYIEADQQAARKLSSSSMMVRMSEVIDAMEQMQINTLSKIIYGADEPNDITKLRNSDAVAVLHQLRELIPGTTEIMGIADYGLDTEVEIAAHLLGKPINFIETPEDQLYFLQKIPPQYFAAAINELIDIRSNTNTAKNYLNNILGSYRSAALGNEKGLMNDVLSPSYLYQKGIGSDRNESLTEKITTIFQESKKTKFIALGAAHLAGKGSVIERLRNAGFITKRLCN